MRALKHRRRGFSLIEVLIAIMVLGIGLLMVAAVFPVGGNWTRQSAEESVAQSVARSTVAVLQQRYGGQGLGSQPLAETGQMLTLTPLPQLTEIPPTERAYQFGAAIPFPAQDATKCTYFWTAVARRSSTNTAEGRSMDVWVLVFHKGSLEQTFSAPVNEVAGVRRSDEVYMPTLATISADQAGAMRVGEYALGHETGTLYKRIIDSSGQAVFQPPLDAGDVTLVVAPAADGTAGSPLVYVYQTTLSF